MDTAELPRKLFNGMDRPAIEVNEGGNNWDHLGSPTFLKSYLANDICVCFKMRSRFAEADSEDHYAVFSKFLGARAAKGKGRAP